MAGFGLVVCLILRQGSALAVGERFSSFEVLRKADEPGKWYEGIPCLTLVQWSFMVNVCVSALYRFQVLGLCRGSKRCRIGATEQRV